MLRNNVMSFMKKMVTTQPEASTSESVTPEESGKTLSKLWQLGNIIATGNGEFASRLHLQPPFYRLDRATGSILLAGQLARTFYSRRFREAAILAFLRKSRFMPDAACINARRDEKSLRVLPPPQRRQILKATKAEAASRLQQRRGFTH
ncbi:hypothetical protein HN011_004520 [Eciton burchellii]|nr:hypothetical protein HN011_004520 [Eciton burchellii]